MPDVSIAVSARNNFSREFERMSSDAGRFNKDLEMLNREVTELGRKKATIKTDLDGAKKELREARKGLDGTAESIKRLEDAHLNVDNIQDGLREISQAARQAQKDLEGADGQVRKSRNGGGALGNEGSILHQIGKAGAYQMIGDAAGEIVGTLVTSVYGAQAGDMFGSVLGGAASGAAIGSMIAPGVGTAIGAGVGALVGAASGAASRFGEQEDAFRSFVQGQVDGQLTRNDAFLDTGKTIAGSREQTFMAFAHRFGSEDQAGDYLERVRRMAIDTNYDYDEIVGYSKSLLNSYNPDDVFGVLATLSDASAGLNLDSSDVNMFIAGLSRMRTTGKAHAQYLNYFSERGVDVYDALAQDQGVDKATAAQMVSDGKITGDQAAQAILSYIDHTFGGLSDKLSTTYDALVDNFGDAEADIQAAAGDAYTNKRKMSIQSDIALLEGETGDKMKSMLSEIGTFKAELDNMQDMHYRDVMRGFFDGVMSEDLDAGLTGRLEEMHQRQLELMEIRESTSATIEEKMAAGAELDALYTEAQIMAETAYLQGEGAKITVDAMVQLAKSVGEASADAFENTGQWLGRRISEGITRGFKADALPTPSFAGRTSLNISGGNSVALSGRARAFGLDRVPHDDYAVRLHAGERVLTANQARQLDNSGGIGGGIAIQMYGTTIREEADIKRVAEELVSELQIAMAAKRP